MITNELLIQIKLAALTHAGGDLSQALVLYDWLIETAVDAEILRRKEKQEQAVAALDI